MDASDFNSASPGRLEPTQAHEVVQGDDGLKAELVSGVGFVPDALPANVDAPSLLIELYPTIVAAERNISRLEGAASRLKNPHLLIGVFNAREAIASSAIENTIASPEDLALLELAPQHIADRDQATEVQNYVRALEHGLRSNLPVSRRLILELHANLLRGVGRQGVQAGRFRESQNFIGRSQRFREARFVPPPPQFVEPSISDLERFVHDEDTTLPRLVRFGMIHYQFEAIHPFGDGNGRVGRLLITLLLCRHAQLSQPLVYVSPYLEQHRDEYCNLLHRVSTHGEWLPWIRFFLEAIATQAEDALLRTDKLIALQSDYHHRVREKRASALLPELIDHLFAWPAVTYGQVEKLVDCSTQTAINLVTRLVEKGILVESPLHAQPRVFYAPGITQLTHG